MPEYSLTEKIRLHALVYTGFTKGKLIVYKKGIPETGMPKIRRQSYLFHEYKLFT